MVFILITVDERQIIIHASTLPDHAHADFVSAGAATAAWRWGNMPRPDYRALIALDKAIAEVEGAPEQSMPAQDTQTKTGKLLGLLDKHISHANAAIAVLTRNGHPMHMSALLPLAREEGAQINGKDPEINFSSSLSRNERLRSVRFEGRPCWWLTDRPFQGEKDFGGITNGRELARRRCVA